VNEGIQQIGWETAQPAGLILPFGGEVDHFNRDVFVNG
jgi:hypothetical protein